MKIERTLHVKGLQIRFTVRSEDLKTHGTMSDASELFEALVTISCQQLLEGIRRHCPTKHLDLPTHGELKKNETDMLDVRGPQIGVRE